jgi:hypothetical protein
VGLFRRFTPRKDSPKFVGNYDETGILVEIHEKFPIDKGHEKIKKP